MTGIDENAPTSGRALTTGPGPGKRNRALRIGSRLGIRLALAVFASILAVEAAILVPSYRNYESDLLQGVEHAGRAAAVAAFRGQAHGEARDLIITGKWLAAGNDDLVGGSLYDLDGGLIGAFGERPATSPDSEPSPSFERSASGDRLEAVWPTQITGLPFTIVARLDTAWVGDELRAFVWRILGLVLLISVVVSGAAMAVLNHMMLAPVLTLRDRMVAAHRRPKAPEEHILPARRSDELGELVTAFNEMVLGQAANIHDLEAAHAALTEARDDLEEQVRARTKDLVAANEKLKEEITHGEQVEEQLRHDALHDALTGHANRVLLMDRLAQAIGRSRRDLDQNFALLLLNLDRFRVVNDSLGHPAGDQLLMVVAERLREALRPGDTVARTAGDEFAVLIEDAPLPEAAMSCASRIREVLKTPILIEAQDVYCTVSIGVTLSSYGYVQPENMMQDAKIALEDAKTSGRDCLRTFSPRMRARNTGLLQIESDLRKAVEEPDRQFVLHYQPVREAASDRVAGFEALVRWQHPKRGLLAPAEFIGLAEDTGLVVPIGRWVLVEAARQLAAWRRRTRTNHPLYVSVNVSYRQFQSGQLLDDVGAALKAASLDPSHLKLEVTESLVMSNPALALSVFAKLKALGVMLLIDDFGTGHSSLSYLRRFPFDALKIDRSFIREMDNSDENREIVGTIIRLAEVLHLDVIVEGVETADQAQLLTRMGCTYLQGFHVGFPLPADDAGRLIAEPRELEMAGANVSPLRR